MPIRTKDLVDLRNGIHDNYTLHEFPTSTLNVNLNFRLNALRDTEKEILKAHKIPYGFFESSLIQVQYKDEYYFGYDNSEKSVILQKPFYSVMDQWIAEYHRVKALILESQIFLDDLFKTASSEPELVALLPRVFYHHKKHQPVFRGQVIYTGKLPLSSQDIKQFAHKHSEIINQFKVIQLDQMTR